MIHTNHHHFLHTRSDHESNPLAKKLRRQPGLSPELQYDPHRRLHEICPAVPLLGRFTIAGVLDIYEPGQDAMHSMDNLLLSIDRAIKNPRIHWVERDLGQLVMYALELQKPYIMEGEVKHV